MSRETELWCIIETTLFFKDLLQYESPTIHQSVGEDHDRVVEVSVLLSDHTKSRSLLLL